MFTRLKHLWHHHRALLLAFCAATIVMLFFAARTIFFTIYWANPAHQQQPLETWMPLRYVAYSWQVNPQDLARALGVTGPLRRRLTIGEIARAQGLSIAQMTRKLRDITAKSSARP